MDADKKPEEQKTFWHKKEKKQPVYQKPSEADGAGCGVAFVFCILFFGIVLIFLLFSACSTPVDYEAHRQANKQYEDEVESMEKANTLYEASRDVANSLDK